MDAAVKAKVGNFGSTLQTVCESMNQSKRIKEIMPRPSPLPERLRYLQPFRKRFASRPPEELNEATGGGPLFVLLRKRIEGHSMAEAEKLLEEDGAALQSWLSAPEQQND